jgi:hypothetical protein
MAAIRQNAYFSTNLLTAVAIVQGAATVLWLALGAGGFSVEYYLYLVSKWRIPLILTVYGCALSNFVEPVTMILIKKRAPRELVHLPMGVWYAWSVLLTYSKGTIRGLLGIRTDWFVTPKFLRGQAFLRSHLPATTRVLNFAACLGLLLLYFLEGWAFGWRDPFALLLVPAFLMASQK